MLYEWAQGEFRISTDPEDLDVGLIHRFLTESYWASGIPIETVQRSLQNSLPFGLYHGDRQIGFARAITDRATFAYLADVFVLEEYRGQRLGQWLIDVVLGHPDLQGLRRWVLLTRDAHGLYRKHGFSDLRQPDRYMEMWEPDIYRRDPPEATPDA